MSDNIQNVLSDADIVARASSAALTAWISGTEVIYWLVEGNAWLGVSCSMISRSFCRCMLLLWWSCTSIRQTGVSCHRHVTQQYLEETLSHGHGGTEAGLNAPGNELPVEARCLLKQILSLLFLAAGERKDLFSNAAAGVLVDVYLFFPLTVISRWDLRSCPH